MDLAQFKADLIRDEGYRKSAYVDSLGYLTIGIGTLIDKRLDAGITEDEAWYLCQSKLNGILADMDRNITWWREMSEPRQRALANMAYSLGWPRLSTFKKMLAALKAGDYDKAAHEAFESTWSGQVGQRANRICKMISEG